MQVYQKAVYMKNLSKLPHEGNLDLKLRWFIGTTSFFCPMAFDLEFHYLVSNALIFTTEIASAEEGGTVNG